MKGISHMIKEILVAYRKPGISREEFYKHWLEVHGPMWVKHMPHMRRYVQNHFVQLPGVEYEGDGIIEIWWDNLELQKKYGVFSNAGFSKELAEDCAKFQDVSREDTPVWVVEEHVLVDRR
jgi:uncharacterized protein (TIGR02118 family)